MPVTFRSLVVLACLAVAGPAFAQAPPTPPAVEPPPSLDPNTPPVLDPRAPPMADSMPVDPLPERGDDNAAKLELDAARLRCQAMPEQERQSCLDAAQRAFEQARRRDDPVR